MNSFTFTIPCTPPSVNTYVRHARGNHYKTKAVKAFVEEVSLSYRALGVSLGAFSVSKNYSVSALVQCKNRRSPDVDNFAKLILDSLVHVGIMQDDRYVSEICIRKAIVADQEPFTQITVTRLDV